jgi:CheY-like chemotaxis protein
MRAVAQQAEAIAHDLTNLLAGIGGYADLAAAATDNPVVAHSVEEIRTAVAEASSMASHLLAFTVRPAQTAVGRVLVVDDGELLRDLMRDALVAGGLEVAVASSGAEAAAIADESPVELLVTDIAMGEISGPELAAHLRASRPELRVIFMSGHAEDVLPEGALAYPGTAFLRKPFTIAELTAQVRELLS